MMKIKICVCLLSILALGTVCSAEAPHGVGGFVLDQPIEDFKDFVIMETALPIRHMENIQEVEIRPIEGFKSGLIAYGSCIRPGHIVRIKMKYADSSKKFYEQLLKRFKSRFGKPDVYRGDPFHIVVGWKWSFTDKDNNNISLTLQHNSMDTEEKLGNSIKLTMTNLIGEDVSCYKNRQLDYREKQRQQKWDPKKMKASGWELYVPR